MRVKKSLRRQRGLVLSESSRAEEKLRIKMEDTTNNNKK